MRDILGDRKRCAGGRARPDRARTGRESPLQARGRHAWAAMLLALALVGCNGEEATPVRFPHGTAALEEQLAEPGLGLVSIGDISNELGERYEDARRWREARAHYRRAVWAYRHAEHLSGATPLLLEDARASLRRVEDQLGTDGAER